MNKSIDVLGTPQCCMVCKHTADRVMKPPNNLGCHVTIRASGAILNVSSSEIVVSPRLGIYPYPDEPS